MKLFWMFSSVRIFGYQSVELACKKWRFSTIANKDSPGEKEVYKVTMLGVFSESVRKYWIKNRFIMTSVFHLKEATLSLFNRYLLPIFLHLDTVLSLAHDAINMIFVESMSGISIFSCFSLLHW